MEPLNKSERKNAWYKFLGVYGISLIIPFICAYFLFNTPNALLVKENEACKKALEEQQTLIRHLQSATSKLAEVEAADKAYMNAANEMEKGSIKATLTQNERELTTALLEIKKDTFMFQVPENQQVAKNVAASIDALLTYRNTITAQRDIIDKSPGANDLQQLNNQVQSLRSENDMLKIMAAQGGGGGGGSGAAAVPVPAGTPVNRDAIKRQVETDMIYGMVKYAKGQKSNNRNCTLYNYILDLINARPYIGLSGGEIQELKKKSCRDD
jgi:hypothetical protein